MSLAEDGIDGGNEHVSSMERGHGSEDIGIAGQKTADAISTQSLEAPSQCEEPPQQTCEMIIKITGTSAQNQAVLHYLKELGVKYEVFVAGE